jgi:hypothetical protein
MNQRKSFDLDLKAQDDSGAFTAYVARFGNVDRTKEVIEPGAFKDVFKEVAPAGLTDTLLSLVPEINPETKVHSITREERRRLVDLLKSLTFTRMFDVTKFHITDIGFHILIDTRLLGLYAIHKLLMIIASSLFTGIVTFFITVAPFFHGALTFLFFRNLGFFGEVDFNDFPFINTFNVTF